MIDVLVVEDDPTSAEALVAYLDRMAGFAVAGQVGTGVEALQRLAVADVDLVLLDIHLPDMSGLDVLRRLRGVGDTVDVVAVTQARDLAVVRAAVAFGVSHYLMKPFTFGSVRQRLERYRTFRSMTADRDHLLAQQEVDHLLRTLRDAEGHGLPKGVALESLQAVAAALRDRQGSGGMSAAEVAEALGASRVTARRYLEHLVAAGLATRRARYQGAGRPELEYAWGEPAGR